MSLLQLQELTVDFATAEGTLRAVDRVDLDHPSGDTLGLIGETGCGKSVIALAILRLLPENASVGGKILFKGRNLLELGESALRAIRGEEIGIILQNPSLALDPIERIGRQIGEPLHIHRGIKMKNTRRAVRTWLERLGFSQIERELDSYPFEMSGGMNQRVVTAASLILRPGLIVADEPTTGLDPELRSLVEEELCSAKNYSGGSLLLISHDLDLTESIADRIAVMYAGQIVEESSSEAFFANPGHPYSRALLKSRPQHGFHPIPGPPIDMTNPPEGCKFAPRCPLADSRCVSIDPAVREKEGRKVKCLKY